MSELSDEISRFEEAIGKTPAAWRSIDVRCVAISLNGEAHNLLTLARLHQRESKSPDRPPSHELLAETPSLLAIRISLPLEALPTLIQAVKAGQASVGDRSVRFVSNFSGQEQLAYSYGWSKLATPLEDSSAGVRSIGHELAISGDNVELVVSKLRGGRERLDQELRAASDPWDGLDALIEHGLGTRRKLNHFATQLIVNASLDIRFRSDAIRLDNGALVIAVETTNGELGRHCTIGYVGSVNGQLGARGTIRTDRDSWSFDQGRYLWNSIIDLQDAEAAAVFLRVGEYVIDRANVIDDRLRVQRPLVRANEVIDPELAVLTGRLLAPLRSEQIEFERAVARVLLFCGFVVDTYSGDSRFSDALDIVAYSDAQRVLLTIECTTGPLQSRDGKLSRLIARTNAIITSLKKDPRSANLDVIPVMATPLESSAISQGDRALASIDNIVVLDNQALSSLLAVARSGAGTGVALTIIRERASSTPGEPDPLSSL